MVKIDSFINALKITWIRRLFQKDSKWSYLLDVTYPDICKFGNYGTDFLQEKLRTVENKFWYDTFISWMKFCEQLKIETWTDFLNQPLWYNKNVKVGGKSVFYKKWFIKGVTFIYDLVDSEGRFISLQNIQNTFGLDTNFLEVNGLLRAVMQFKIKYDFAVTNYNIMRPSVPLSIKILQYDKKGCQRINKILSYNKNIPVAQRKWQNDLMIPADHQWTTVYTQPYKITKDTNLQWFQYRILHRIIATNTFLFKISIKDNNRCTFCNTHPETILHLFWNCPHTQLFWHELEEWLKQNCGHIRDLNLTKEDIIFGILKQQRADVILNFIILLGKKFIYKMKYKNTKPCLQIFKKEFVFNYNTEMYIAYCNCNWTKFNKRWMPYKTMMSSIALSYT